MEIVVNFNHLIEKRVLRKVCYALNHKECYYQPAGDGRATSGKNVHVVMRCKNCGRCEDVFLSEREYISHSRILENEVSNV
jgi:hypothetical protein